MANEAPTTLDPAQIQFSIHETQIVAEGNSLYAAGTASVASAKAAAATAPADCNDGSWELTQANYNNALTDKDLATCFVGGKDTDGITYPGMFLPYRALCI